MSEREVVDFWAKWDAERASEWLREQYLSFRLEHAALRTEAAPETFADMFVQWCVASKPGPVYAFTWPCCGGIGVHGRECARNTTTPEPEYLIVQPGLDGVAWLGEVIDGEPAPIGRVADILAAAAYDDRLVTCPECQSVFDPEDSTIHDVCADCDHIHTPTGCTGPPSPSDRWAGVSPSACDCDATATSPDPALSAGEGESDG